MTNGMSNATITGIFSNFKFEIGYNASHEANNIEEFNNALSRSKLKADDIENTIKAKKEEITKMKLKQRSESNLDWQSKTAVYDDFKERTYYTQDDPKSLDDVIGMESVKQEMTDKVLAPLNPILKNYFSRMNIKPAGGIILHGPGGVGKTFIAKRLAYSLLGCKDKSKVSMVQFHQSYSYEDFIMGYRPSGEGFSLKNGVFYDFCKQAQDDEENDYYFIIDEINRGNLSKIFGEYPL
jgi:predicted ATPase